LATNSPVLPLRKTKKQLSITVGSLKMDDSYSSSFDSDDSSEQNYPLESPKIPVRLTQPSSASMRVKSKQAQQERFDPQLLNDAVRELQRLNHERLSNRVPSGKPLRPVRNRTFTETQVQHIDQVNGVLVRKILEQQMRPVRFSADASKRTPNFPTSATINRRRKQQQIDSDNLVIDSCILD